MLVTEKSSFGNFASHLLVKRSGKRSGRNSKTTLAQKREISEDSKPQQSSKFTLRISRSFLAQSAIGIFGLGFIDAGYSGDWSRIGVISKETEDLLRIATFAVVPLCLFLIFSLPKETEV